MEASSSQSSTKRSKSCTDDRLSSLPESVLHHLLSFLDTKYVVKTSVLSKSWRYLWTLMPSLYFNWNYYCLNHTIRETEIKFMNTVDQVLVIRPDSNLQKFRLVCGDFWEPLQICKWIEIAIARNLQEIYLEITEEEFKVIELPPSLFTCESLEVMELKFVSYWPCIVLMLPDSITISLPRLKTLRLGSVMFYDDMNELFSTCPVLETLSLKLCTFVEEKNLNISALRLKNLVIENLVMRCHLSEFKVNIHTPLLTSFRCKDFMVNDYVIENASSLENAEIDMAVDRDRDPEGFELYFEKKGKHGRRVINTITELHSVKTLTLSSWSLQFLSEVVDELEHHATLFRNLRCLTVATFCSSSCYRTLTYLVKSFPNIETLILLINKDICPSYQEDGKTSITTKLSSKQHDEQWEKELLSNCMLYHLNFVEIREFKGSKIELEFLKFLLKNTVALEKLVINGHEATSSFREKLLKEFNDKLISSTQVSPSVAI